MKPLLLILLALCLGASVPPVLVSSKRPASGGASFTYTSVQFDGANDYLTRGANLTGIADSKVGTLSFWIKFTGGDGDFVPLLYTDVNLIFRVYRQADVITFTIGDGLALKCILQSNNSYTTASGWIHILIAWNLAANVGQMSINDGADTGALSFALDSNIAYSGLANWSILALTGGGIPGNALVSEFYFTTEYVGDLTSSTTRRKFISGTGHPVDLGANGSTPTGTQPLIYLHTPVPNWEVNLGSGGGMTENGTLTDGGADIP